jgi:two-component system CheB/CheR fusion protein
VAPRGLRLPIDFFLRSLAEDRQERAIGVVLSGMGSDGVFGLRAIKEKGGLTLAQEPASAQADSMPRSAIEAGVVDIVAPAEALPQRIAELPAPPGQHELSGVAGADRRAERPRPDHHPAARPQRQRFLAVQDQHPVPAHRAAHGGAPDGPLKDYVRHLRGNPQELDLLFKELLIGVTSFFRDAEVWEALRTERIPALLAKHPDGKALRAWVAACSTGEEAYSLAMVFKEALETLQPEARYTLQIYATDLDADAIDQARKGLYPDNIAADVSAERLARHFVPEEGGGYRIAKDIREMVVFAPQNITNDPPFTKLDILTCRNLLIYFGPSCKRRCCRCSTTRSTATACCCWAAPKPSATSATCSPRWTTRRASSAASTSHPVPTWSFPARMVAASPPTTEARATRPTASENLGLTDQLIQQPGRRPRCWSMPTATSSTSAAAPANTWSRPPASTNINIHAMAREGLREALTGVIRKALKDPSPSS